jgi:hypothetical protein
MKNVKNSKDSNSVLIFPSGLYYKHVAIINGDSSIISKWSFKLIDDPESSFTIAIGL